MLEEIFGRNNRISFMNWECKVGPINQAKFISNATDYVLIYAVNKDKAFIGSLPRTDEMDKKYNMEDAGGKFMFGNLSGIYSNEAHVYGIENPLTGKVYYPPKGRSWRGKAAQNLEKLAGWGVEYFVDDKGDLRVKDLDRAKAKQVAQDKVYPTISFGKNGITGPCFKRYLSSVKDSSTPKNYITGDKIEDMECLNVPWEVSDINSNAKHLVKKIIGDAGFSTPKPLKLTELLVKLFCPVNGHVLDVFAGSGTTGHAVLSLNNKEGASRSFTLVEQADYAESRTYGRIHNLLTGDWYIGKQPPLAGECEFIEGE